MGARRLSSMLVTAATLLLAACAGSSTSGPAPGAETTAPAPDVATALDRAVAGDWRSDAHKKRDRYRHPIGTLMFFGLRPDMTVVELWPGGGWYTEILAPVLHDQGHLIEASFAPDASPDYRARMAADFKNKLAGRPDIYGNVSVVPFAPPGRTRLGPPNSADMVLTFRNLHNWINEDTLPSVFQAAYRVLKPGGVFGVVEHRAGPDWKPQESARKGYVPEPYVIELAHKTGFKLVAQTELNANPNDTKDYPKGVWTLPPTLRLGDKNRDYYQAIGESDRMTLKFIKPPAAESEGESASQ
ncbi:MAG: methyltransferase domain-containing protein [Gammaproteobacteria bacterium]